MSQISVACEGQVCTSTWERSIACVAYVNPVSHTFIMLLFHCTAGLGLITAIVKSSTGWVNSTGAGCRDIFSDNFTAERRRAVVGLRNKSWGLKTTLVLNTCVTV